MKLSKEEYKEAKDCLKRYNYNCISIMNIRADIISIGAQSIDGLPKAPYNISNNILNSVIKLQENKHIQQCVKEVKAVQQALALINDKDYNNFFENYYMKGKSKWEVINEGISERTFERKNQNLIYTVHNELKKLAENWRNLIKISGIINTVKNVAGTQSTSLDRATKVFIILLVLLGCV